MVVIKYVLVLLILFNAVNIFTFFNRIEKIIISSIDKTPSILRNPQNDTVNYLFTTKYTRSLLDRNQYRLDRLRQYYDPILKIESFYQPQTNKTMVYTCRVEYAGWGDRLRGIMSVYVLALFTRRRFMIDMEIPASILEVLQPNLVNWTYVSPVNSPEKNRTRLKIRTVSFEHTLL